MKFKSDIEVQAGLRDGGNDIGTAGQILSSTGSQTNWIDQSSIVASEAKLVFIECKNTSGGTISKGTPVYQTGTVGATDVIEVGVADASDENKMAAIGLLQTDLANNAFGKVVITGELLNITTSPIDGVTPVTGDTIYVKSGGGLTLTKPTGVNFIQNIGLVGKVSGGSAGSITVSSIMRSNDVPTPLYIDHTNQRLGIGIETPDSTLHIAGDSTAVPFSTVLKVESTANEGSVKDIHIYNQYDRDIGIKFETLGGENYIWQDSNGDDALILSSGGSNRTADATLILEQDHDVLIPNGNVGIGTTSPNASLQIGSAVATSSEKLDVRGNSSANYVASFEQDHATGYGVLIDTDGTLVSEPALRVKNTASDLFYIGSNGNVGIGTDSPGSKLEISSTSDALLELNGGTTANPYMLFAQNGTRRAFIQYVNGGLLSLASEYGHIRFMTGTGGTETEKMRITSAGNVGIGTTSPEAKLDVAGNIKIQAALLSNQENTDIDSAAAEVVAQVAISYTAAFFDFVVKKGTNVRSGTVYACHDGTNVEFTETSTNDLGDTSDVTLSVDKTSTNLRLIATVTSDDWSVKSLIRAI